MAFSSQYHFPSVLTAAASNMVAFSSEYNVPSLLTAAASLIGTAVLLKSYFSSPRLKSSNQLTIVIEEFDALTPNHMFQASNLYLSTKISPSPTRIKVNKSHKQHDLAVTVEQNEQIIDVFENIKFKWILQSSPIKSPIEATKNGNSPKTELRYFELSFPERHKNYALKVYLPYILKTAFEIRDEIRPVRLHTLDYSSTDYWSSIPLNHPARFETMAMDPSTKRDLIEDLDRFVNGKEYYRRVGKAWKRGYLFYGPPGTGKSSLVAAMANHLNFDVYDLDLSEVQCNSDLRRLMIGTANRSIIVIEDIDCNFGLMNRDADNSPVTQNDKISLSRFMDGLWSSCGEERIIVITTNHNNRLDPALIMPGRMDVQIEMSYCTFDGFKILAATYLKVEEHSLFPVIQDLLRKVEATPAQVIKELMKSYDAEIALSYVVQFLQDKDKETVVALNFLSAQLT